MLALLKWMSLGLLAIVEVANSNSYTYIESNHVDGVNYDPTWESLDTRPLPGWYDEAKFGIFIHWGVFSVPSFGSEWFWDFWQGQNRSEYEKFMTKNYAPGFSYQDFARDFTAEFYDPKDWAEIFQSSGAKYVVLTTKHHEGYTLWPSKYSFSWNAQDVGPHRDLVGELATAIRTKTDLKFGLYHSLFEWFNPLYVQDRENNFTTQDFVDQKTMPELYELVNNYEPDLIWSDGEGEAPDTYWRSRNFIAWLYNETPKRETVVVNDRWGSGVPCNHGDFYTCADRYNPGVLQPHKWENCMTIDKKSWGFRRNAKLKDYLKMEDLVKELVQTVSCGGNLLMNIGPTKDGIIVPIFEERLRGMGSWLKINGEAIYGSKPWTHQNDTLTKGVWYTMTGDNAVEKSLYAMVLQWPSGNLLHLGAPKLSEESTISLLGYPTDLQWETSTAGITVHFPSMSDVSSNWAWTLKISNAIGSKVPCL